MGAAMELLTGFATAPSTTYTALTMAAGNSNTIRNADLSKAVRLLSTWVDVQGAGNWRIRSPKLHDNVQGINFNTTIGDTTPLLPMHAPQRLYPQDVLTLELTGSATGGDIETACLLVHYEDLPGNAARLVGPDEIMRRGVNYVTVNNTLALGTAGGYSGEEAINAETDLLKANTDYALLGYVVSAECAAVRWRGADTSNLGVGGPGNETLRQVTCEWFLRLSRLYNLQLIPVFNSANRGGILVDGAQDENGTDVTVSSIFVELAPATR